MKFDVEPNRMHSGGDEFEKTSWINIPDRVLRRINSRSMYDHEPSQKAIDEAKQLLENAKIHN